MNVELWWDGDWDRWALPVGCQGSDEFTDDFQVVRVDLPVERAAELKAAWDLIDAVRTEIIKLAGVHPDEPRLLNPCETWNGTTTVFGERSYDSDCEDCGWERREHRV